MVTKVLVRLASSGMDVATKLARSLKSTIGPLGGIQARHIAAGLEPHNASCPVERGARFPGARVLECASRAPLRYFLKGATSVAPFPYAAIQQNSLGINLQRNSP